MPRRLPAAVRHLLLALALLLFALPAAAQPDDPVARLATTLRLPEVIEVMRLEGLDYGKRLESDLFPGKGGTAWSAEVAKIYDPAALSAAFADNLRAALPAKAVPGILAFFDSARGRRIVSLEISARRALLTAGVKEEAQALLGAMIESDDPRLARLTAFVSANDLVGRNVAATVAADEAFYRGLVAGHAKGFEMTPAQIEAEVSGQQAAIRKDTETWLFPFLALAYQPLSDEDLDAYIAFSRSSSGKVLNAALFKALGGTFTGLSGQLGQAAAPYISGSAL